MTKQELTPQEKIDYIYNIFKKEEEAKKRQFYFKIASKVFLILFILFMYFFGIKMIISGVKNMVVSELEQRKNAVIQNVGDGYDNLKENINSGVEKIKNLWD